MLKLYIFLKCLILLSFITCDSATGSSQKPKGEYMSLTGAVNYSYDPTTNNSVQHYFTENEWLNVTCKLMYPDDLSHMYDGRYMWWELEDQNGTVRNKTSQNKITDQLNSYAINLILAEKYDKWSLSCRHAEVEGGRLNDAAKLGTVKIILHAKKKQSISTTTTTSTEAPAKSDEYEHEENDSPPEEKTSGVIIATAAVLVTLTIILAVVLACYICKKNHKPKQDDNLPSAYADLNFVNQSDNIIRSSEPNSLYSEIVFENDEVGYATVLDKNTDIINIEESPYAEVNPYIQVSFANNSRQQMRDLYAKVLPKSQRNKKLEKNPSNGKDLYATVVPKSERKRIFAKGEADDVSKNDKIQMGTPKNKMNCSTYANTSKDFDLYASIEPYNANKTYANVNIKSVGKDNAVQYVNCDVENKAECNYANSNVEQKTRDCTRDTSKDNNNCNQVYFNERKKLITG